MTTTDTIEHLNDLLTKAYDAEQGFDKAAERAEGHPGLVRFFKHQSEMRLAFGHDIKQAITKYGGKPDKGASATAKAHQVWITMKDALTGDQDEEAILEECVRGEKAALKAYDEKLKCADLPADVREMIAAQRTRVADSLTEVKLKELCCG